MSATKPFIEQMSDMAKENVPNMSDINSGANVAFKNVEDSLNVMKDGVKNTLDEFSSKTQIVNASSEFLDSNSLLAKLSFIVLVLIAFMLILKLMMSLLGKLLSPSSNPYIIKGTLTGASTATITQEPGKNTTIEILRSNDKNKGLEFTWSTWLFLNEPDAATEKYKNIFVKGNNLYDDSGVSLTNGPGLYVKAVNVSNSLHYNLFVVIDHIGSGESISVGNYNSGRDGIEVEHIPIMKWVHVAIRMQNMIMDIYVNGTIVKRHNMDKLPKQNSNDIIVSGNQGFPGSLSNLRYFSYALNVFEINSIVMGGPSLTPSKLSVDATATSGNYSYLSNLWYNAAN